MSQHAAAIRHRLGAPTTVSPANVSRASTSSSLREVARREPHSATLCSRSLPPTVAVGRPFAEDPRPGGDLRDVACRGRRRRLAARFLLVASGTARQRRCGTVDRSVAIRLRRPARRGRRFVCQTLVRHLLVSHFTNLTSLFPAAPLTATRLFSRFLAEPVSEYRSFYGRTTRLSGLNDALYLWDRWLGADRLDASPILAPRRRR